MYLDHASTSPLCERAIEAMRPWTEGRHWGNPSSLHQQGREARKVLEDCRDRVAELLACRSRDVIFTSGATEANVLACRGTAMTWDQPRGILASPLEHPSVIENVEQLGREGVPITWIRPEKEGKITVETVEQDLDQSVGLLVAMLANNEIGHVTDIKSISNLCEENSTQIHCDATQAVGHMEVNFSELNVDTLSLSSHKLGGPQGVGVLIARRQAHLASLNRGGSQELGRRGGTENVAGVVGFTAALEDVVENLEERCQRWLTLRTSLEDQLKNLPGIVFNSIAEPRLPHIVNVSFKGIEGEALLIRLDMEGVYLSSGSACHADQPEPSHVLKNMGRSNDLAAATLRFSFGPNTTQEELESSCKVLENILMDLRKS